MLIKNKKGFSLIELLISLAIVGLVSPLIFVIFVSGIEDYSTTTKYMNQQYSVMEVTSLIRKDIEEAKTITLKMNSVSTKKIDEITFEFRDPTTNPARKWSFGTFTDPVSGVSYDGLKLSVGGGSYEGVVGKLDLTKCSFAVDTIPGPTKIILTIKPENLNKTKYKGRNVNENIITEFSVRYKEIK